MRKIKTRNAFDIGDNLLPNLHTLLSVTRYKHNQEHYNNQKYRDRGTHSPILCYKEMLLDSRTKRNDSVTGNQSSKHEQ